MTSWIEMSNQNENSVDRVGEDVPTNLCIMNLAGCLELDDVVVEEKDGLNFKDVVNVLLPDKIAYVGYDTPTLPVSGFAGMVTKILSDANPEEACAFSVGNKIYGLPFCEGDESVD